MDGVEGAKGGGGGAWACGIKSKVFKRPGTAQNQSVQYLVFLGTEKYRKSNQFLIQNKARSREQIHDCV